MATTAATTGANTSALLSQLGQGLQSLQGLGVSLPGTTGGGGTTGAAATAGATTTAPASGASNPSGLNARIPATGKYEMRTGADGRTRYFDDGKDPSTGLPRADGKAYEITAFQYTDAHAFKINLDYREGLATGLANLARMSGARQERVRLLSNALANDANTTGSFNPVDLQKMSLETTTTQQLSELEKKIFDSMTQATQAWLR
jgi:hypothetical protein